MVIYSLDDLICSFTHSINMLNPNYTHLHGVERLAAAVGTITKVPIAFERRQICRSLQLHIYNARPIAACEAGVAGLLVPQEIEERSLLQLFETMMSAKRKFITLQNPISESDLQTLSSSLASAGVLINITLIEERIDAILHAPTIWWARNKHGRLLNKFSDQMAISRCLSAQQPAAARSQGEASARQPARSYPAGARRTTRTLRCVVSGISHIC